MSVSQEEWTRLKAEESYGMYVDLSNKLESFKDIVEKRFMIIDTKIDGLNNRLTRDQKDQWKMISDMSNEIKNIETYEQIRIYPKVQIVNTP
jgi:hypothetical protein